MNRKRPTKRQRRPRRPAAFEPSPPPPPAQAEWEKPLKWGWLFLGALSLAVGTWYWAGGDPRWLKGLPFQVFAWWAVQHAFPRVLFPAPATDPREGRPGSAGLIIAALVFAVAGTVLFAGFRLLPWGLAAFGISAICLLLSGHALPDKTAPPWSRKDAWVLVLLLAVAAALRFPFVDSASSFTGLQIDEANSLVDSLGIMRGENRSPFRTVWGGNPSFTHFPLAGLFLVFPHELWVGRALAAAASLVAVLYFYRWVRFFVPTTVAALATALFSVSWWHLYYGLSPFHNILQLALQTAAVFHLERCLREGRRGDAWWSGILAAATVMSYISGRLVPVIMLLVGLQAWVTGRRKGMGRLPILGGLAFLWLFAPFIHFVHENPQEFLSRGQQLSIFQAMDGPEGWKLLWSKVWVTILSPNWPNARDVDARFNVPGNPFLDPVAGTLYVLGAVLLLRRIGTRMGGVFAAGVSIGFAANILSYWHLIPYLLNGHRYFFILPFLFLGVAAGLGSLADTVRRLPPWFRTAGRSILAGALLFALLWNAKVYFFDFQLTHNCRFAQAFVEDDLSRLYNTMGRSHQLVVDWRLYQSHHQFLTKNRFMKDVIQDDAPSLVWERGRNVLFVVSNLNRAFIGKLNATFPKAHWTEPPRGFGMGQFRFCSVPVRTLERWDGRFREARN